MNIGFWIGLVVAAVLSVVATLALGLSTPVGFALGIVVGASLSMAGTILWNKWDRYGR